MSVLKNLDIDLPQSEKKTLFRFLSLYLFFTVIILVLTASLYYNLQEEIANNQKKIALDEYANSFLTQLEELQKDKTGSISYPKSTKFKTSLYGEDYKLIYSTLSQPLKLLTEVKYTNNKIIRYITDPHKYYLNTQYIIVEIEDTKEWLYDVMKTVVFYGLVFFIFMMLIGYFLLKLFLKPMRDALHLLDTFIKDTTHELNTPISTVLTNIELIDKEKIQDKYLLKIINRIDIGAKTISNVYDDLTYLTLNNRVISDNQATNLSLLIAQRVEYFSILSNKRKINVIQVVDPDVILVVDNKKITKLIDNILSNAIKYNKFDGSIYITLSDKKLIIKDTGKGIEQEHIDSMFERYARFDTTVGGFGIGLNIVKMICEEYHYTIDINSEIKKWTEVTITF